MSSHKSAPHIGATLSFQPRIRKGAFFEAAWRNGCRQFSVYNRTYISGPFADPVEEYWGVTSNVSIWPVMGERQVEVSGPDAARFVQYLTPRDMGHCAVGQCKYALITASDGGILSDPIILKLARPFLAIDLGLRSGALGERCRCWRRYGRGDP